MSDADAVPGNGRGLGEASPTLDADDQAVLDALRALGQAGYSMVSARLRKSPGWTRRALERLVSARLVRRVGAGLYEAADEGIAGGAR